MRILNIRVKNFGPLVGDVSLDLSNVSAATISGPNEAGKSTLIKAVKVGLFGGDSLDKLISDLHDEAEVELVFSHNNETYTILRTIDRKGQKLKLWCGDKDISERLLTATKKKLDEILKFSQTFLLSTSIAEQDEVNRLAIMTPSEREKVISEMLSLEVWEAKKKKVNEILNNNKTIFTDIEQTQILLNTLESSLEKDNKTINDLQDSLIVPGVELELIEKEIDNQETALQEFQTQNKLITEKNKLNIEITSLEEKLAELPKDPKLQEKIIEELDSYKENEELIKESKEAVDILEKGHFIIMSDIYQVKGFIQDLPQTKILDEVPCKNLDIYQSCKLLQSALKKSKEIQSFLQKKEVPSLEQQLRCLEELKTDNEKEKKELQDGIETLSKENEKLNLKINNYKNQLKEQLKADTIEKELAEKYTKLHNLENKTKDKIEFNNDNYLKLNDKRDAYKKIIHDAQLTIVKIETDIKHTSENIEKTNTKLNEFKEIDSNLANYRTLHTAYNEIPTLLFQQAIPALEMYTNEILQKVSPGKTVELRAFRDTKSNTQQKALDIVSNMNTGVRDFGDLSGSAKFRQSLALRIALARYNKELNNVDIPMFIVDEGFGSLDGENLHIMKYMLKEIASQFDLFLMISHIESLNDVFNTQIIVNTTGKGNKIDVRN